MSPQVTLIYSPFRHTLVTIALEPREEDLVYGTLAATLRHDDIIQTQYRSPKQSEDLRGNGWKTGSARTRVR